MTLDKFDELFASCARPYTIYASATAIVACCFFKDTAQTALLIAGGLAGGAAVLRTIDKKTATTATNPQPATTAGKTG